MQMTGLEKKWWFAGAVSFATALITIPLLLGADIWPVSGFAQAVVCFFCFLVIYRALSVLGRVLVLFLFPSSKLLD